MKKHIINIELIVLVSVLALYLFYVIMHVTDQINTIRGANEVMLLFYLTYILRRESHKTKDLKNTYVLMGVNGLLLVTFLTFMILEWTTDFIWPLSVIRVLTAIFFVVIIVNFFMFIAQSKKQADENNVLNYKNKSKRSSK